MTHDEPTGGPGEPTGEGAGERAERSPGVDALQAAAEEAIGAARALLDVAETLVRDPDVAARIGSVARAATRAARTGAAGNDRASDRSRSTGRGSRQPDGPGGPDGPNDDDDPDDDDDGGVQRIPVS